MVPSVVPSLEVPGGQMGPRGTAGNDKSLRCSISVAVPPGPMLLPLETPCCCASKPQVRRALKPLGANFETKIFKFCWFLDPSDQNELYHTPLLSKMWDIGDRNFLWWRIPLKTRLFTVFFLVTFQVIKLCQTLTCSSLFRCLSSSSWRCILCLMWYRVICGLWSDVRCWSLY